jgi:hypothetical protein
MNPELFSVGVSKSWEFIMVIQVETHAIALWIIKETIKVELDEMRVLDDAWGLGHGEVKWSLESTNSDIKGVWSFLSNHGVKSIDFSINSF